MATIDQLGVNYIFSKQRRPIVPRICAGQTATVEALGNLAGPTVTGVNVGTEGFSKTTLIFFGLHSVMLLINIIEAVKVITISHLFPPFWPEDALVEMIK